MKSINDIEYAKRDEASLLLDLHLPDGSDGPFPVIICIPGGGWQSAMKGGLPLYLVEHGFAVVGVEYRVSNVALAPANIQDIRAAVDWIVRHAEQYHLDSARIGAYGASAGGHLAALLGVSLGIEELADPGTNHAHHMIRAVCDVCGPTDLNRMAVPGIQKAYPLLHEVTVGYLGGPVEYERARATLVSPLTYVKKTSPPVLLIHGDKDDSVPLEESRIFHGAMKSVGATSTLLVVEGGGHGWLVEETADKVAAFFLEHLK
jgi:acetyl esterase/lipase